MCEQTSAWNKYATSVRQYDAVFEHAKAVSSSLVGLIAPTANASYGEHIFVTILAHCTTLRRLAPDPTRRTPNELWDLPSMCAVARCAIEAHDAFLYIAGSAVPLDERDFRISLWELHDKTRRLKMLESLSVRSPEVQVIRAACSTLAAKVKAHPNFGLTKPAVQKKVLAGDPPAFHQSQRERCQSDEINFDYYNTATMQLSQYVHTFPFALHQLSSFRAGSHDVLPLMSLPLQYVLPFLGRVTTETRTILPYQTPDAPARTAQTMVKWDAIYRNGVKSGA
jgi:hypothetical protein